MICTFTGAWFAVAIAADASDEFSKIYWEYEEVDKYGPYVWHEKEKKKPGVDPILEGYKDTLAEQRELFYMLHDQSIFHIFISNSSSFAIITEAMLEKVIGTAEPAAAEESKVQKRRSRKLLTNDPQSLYLSANALDSYNAAMSSRDFAHKLVQWKNVIISDLEEVSDPDINFCETGLAYDRAFNSIELDIVAKSFEDAAAELRTIREGIRSQLTETAHSLCQFATLNFIEEKLDYNTLRESVSDGGVDTPRTATEFAAVPNWHEDLWDQVEGQSENNAAIPNIGTDDPHPNSAITDEDVISGLNDLAYSYLNSSDFSLVMWNGFDRPGTNMKGSRHYFDHQSSVDFGNAVTVAHFMASRKVPYDLPRLQAQRSNATVYLNPIVCDDGAVVNLRKGLRFALDMAIERKHIINSLYRAAAKANETSVLRFMRTDKIRWLRGGDIDDQPEWGESLLMSNARRIEDMRKIIRTFVQVETFEGYADWYIDHQMPDTVP